METIKSLTWNMFLGLGWLLDVVLVLDLLWSVAGVAWDALFEIWEEHMEVIFFTK